MHDTTITPETARKIQQFCRTISVAYDLDDEIQEELCGHIEDKLLGYLSGEEALTEEDAFVLVREHFGSPENVRELLEEAHGRTTRGAYARRLGAVLVATAAVEILISLRLYAVAFMKYIDRLLFPIARDFAGNTSVPFSPLSFFTRWFGLIAIALLLWYILVRWQKGIKGDRPPWYQRLKPSLFVGLFAVAILLQMVDPMIRSMDHAEEELYEMRRPLPVSSAIKPDIDVFSGGFIFRQVRLQDYRYHFGISYLALQLLAWFWWCDMPKRRIRTLLATLGIWICYWTVLPVILPRVAFYLNQTTRQINMTLFCPLFFGSFIQSVNLYFYVYMGRFLGLGAIVLGIYLALTRLRIMEQRTGMLGLREELA